MIYKKTNLIARDAKKKYIMTLYSYIASRQKEF